MSAPVLGRTQVAIIGAGPAGLILSQLLHLEGLRSVVLERRSRTHVEARIRAGVLEPGAADLLVNCGVGGRLVAEGLVHNGFALSIDGDAFRVDLARHVEGGSVRIYGQTEITRDLIEAHATRGHAPIFEVEDVALEEITSDRPAVRFRKAGVEHRLSADFIAGCDGFHGCARAAIPDEEIMAFHRAYACGWLGILADVPPCSDELIYATSERGFALASMRSPTRSRYYVQCRSDERLAEWPDERLWDEIEARLGEAGRNVQRAPALEKSVAPLRSWVFEPMSYGRLFLAGDAAHIVPPTGAKGLNLAVADVLLLGRALANYYRSGSEEELRTYSARALRRVWRAERFSWWFTRLLHRLDDADGFEQRLRLTELDELRRSPSAQKVLAENYLGLMMERA